MRIVLLLFLCCLPSFGRDWYFGQTSAGANDGTSCANRKDYTWEDNAANWGAGSTKIDAGDTLHLCGTLTSQWVARGQVAQMVWEPGAKVSVSGAGARVVYIQSRTDLILDGGLDANGNPQGIIECTANGSALANQNNCLGIDATSTRNITYKNLVFTNLYQHTLLSDVTLNGSATGAIYGNGAKGYQLITNCYFTNVCWGVNFPATEASATTTISVGDCRFFNYDHGIAFANTASSQLQALNCISNHFGTTSNWDTTADAYHHDGIHYFGASANTTTFNVAKSRFEGDWGGNNTGHIYTENSPANMVVWDNLHVFAPTNILANGCFNMPNNSILYNCTFIGDGTSGQIALYCAANNRQVSIVNCAFTSVGRYFATVGATGVGFTAIRNNLYAAAASANPWQLNTVLYPNFTAWDAVVDETGSSYTANAQLSSTGYPSSSSPVVDAGYTLSSTYNTDIINTNRPQRLAWDIGAYELPGTVGIIIVNGVPYYAVGP